MNLFSKSSVIVLLVAGSAVSYLQASQTVQSSDIDNNSAQTLSHDPVRMKDMADAMENDAAKNHSMPQDMMQGNHMSSMMGSMMQGNMMSMMHGNMMGNKKMSSMMPCCLDKDNVPSSKKQNSTDADINS